MAYVGAVGGDALQLFVIAVTADALEVALLDRALLVAAVQLRLVGTVPDEGDGGRWRAMEGDGGRLEGD